MGLDLYPGAKWAPSSIPHPMRERTLGIVMHWTAGSEPGDIRILRGPNVDCQFYVAKDGDVYQFLDPDSQGWHALHTANHTCIGIEHEGRGEPYTDAQFAASSRLVSYLCVRYGIPPVHASPRSGDLDSLRGIFGHGDLTKGGVDGNNHTDTVPEGTGWGNYLAAVKRIMGQDSLEAHDLSDLPGNGTLRLIVEGHKWSGWGDCEGPMRWIGRNGLNEDAEVSFAWQGNVWRDTEKVVKVVRTLVGRYLG